MNQFIRAFLFSFALMLHAGTSFAWDDAGHRAIAEIAYSDLTPQAKQSVDKIVDFFNKSHHSYKTFGDLSTWPDHLQPDEKVFLYTSLHFIVLPYDPEGVLSDKRRQELLLQSRDGALVSIAQAKAVLANKQASLVSKCWALSYLAHVVADLHQPMHCCTKFSKEFPSGDRGGNHYLLLPQEGSRAVNLHKLWDSAGGLLPILSEDSLTDERTISSFARKVKLDLPKEKLSACHIIDPNLWTVESYAIAKEHAYKVEQHTTPSSEYLKNMQFICKERLALAGYRLADTLNEVFAAAATD